MLYVKFKKISNWPPDIPLPSPEKKDSDRELGQREFKITRKFV
jgi:hypothetical protein